MMALRFASMTARSSTVVVHRRLAVTATRNFTTSRALRSEDARAPATISSPKVRSIYDELLTLNIVETIELVKVLKEKFGYVEQAIVAAPAGGGGGGGPAAAAEEVAKPAEKTIVTVRLKAFDAAKKISVIKEVKTLLGLGLKQAKDLVEAAPDAILKKDIPKADAEELMEKLKAAGGEAIME
jgi:large subunit ribosomal protein L7/L12